MGWLGDIGLGFASPAGLLGTAAAGSAEDQRNSIDSQIAGNQFARPGALDPNALVPDLTGQLDSRLNDTKQSPWLKMQLDQNRLQTGALEDRAAAQAAGGAATARSALAMKGGLTGGAAERIARGTAQDALMGGQDAARAGDENRLKLFAGDEDRKRQNAALWSNLASNQSEQRSNIAQTNYAEAMKAWAANNTANAQLAASKKQGLFGLGLGPF